MVRTPDTSSRKPTYVYGSKQASNGKVNSVKQAVKPPKEKEKEKVEEEWEDENEELLQATKDTRFTLSLRVTNDKSGARPITYDPVHFKGCRFQDGSIGWKTGPFRLVERVSICYTNEKGRKVKGAVPCTMFTSIVMNETMPKGFAKRMERESSVELLAARPEEEEEEEEEKSSSSSDEETAEESSSEEEAETSAELPGYTSDHGDYQSENEASRVEDDSGSDKNDVAVELRLEHLSLDKKKKGKKARRSEIVGGKLKKEEEE